MQLKQLELVGGGALTVYLRDSCDRMPSAIDRPWESSGMCAVSRSFPIMHCGAF